jgi:hypothetical protein
MTAGRNIRPAARLTVRDRAILARLAQHEPLTTSELRLLFFTGPRTCRARLKLLHDLDVLTRVYPARASRGGKTEPLWFLTPHGRILIQAPARRPPGLSIPDLEHRRDVARFFLSLIQRSLEHNDEGLWSWLGERAAEQALGGAVRPDGYGRYLLPDGELTFYLELDRGTEPTSRVTAKLDAYGRALATDPDLRLANILLICPSPRRLASLARHAPTGPPWTWGSTDSHHYQLLGGPDQTERRQLEQLPLRPRDTHTRPPQSCLARRWQHEQTKAREAA